MDKLVIATINFKNLEELNNGEKIEWLAAIMEENVLVGIDPDIYVLPAGFISTQCSAKDCLDTVIEDIKQIINEVDSNSLVCVGFDGEYGTEQLAFTTNRHECLGIARKFHHMKESAHELDLAVSFLEEENGYSRILECKGKKFYLAVCYDIYGIKNGGMSNPGVDAILNVIHVFNRRGESGSDESGFARKGLAGASDKWKCPVYCAVNFSRRSIPENWPTGVLYDNSMDKSQYWKYKDNLIRPFKTMLNDDEEYEIKYYHL
jgi:hypothetical protein